MQLQQEIGEIRCLARLGDLVRPELNDFTQGILGTKYGWSDVVRWWEDCDPTFEKKNSPPATLIMDLIDSMYRNEQGWVRGGAWHDRLYRHVAGCAIFWSDRCRRSHAEIPPQKLGHAKRYRYLSESIRSIALGKFKFANRFVASAITNFVTKEFRKYEEIGQGKARHKESRAKFDILTSRRGGEGGMRDGCE